MCCRGHMLWLKVNAAQIHATSGSAGSLLNKRASSACSITTEGSR